jgi:hypothetical protein
LQTRSLLINHSPHSPLTIHIIISSYDMMNFFTPKLYEPDIKNYLRDIVLITYPTEPA